MKTIKINLIGELGKNSRALKLEIKKDTVDPKTRIMVLGLLISAMVVFISSFGLWLLTKFFNTKTNIELSNLRIQSQNLKKEEEELINYEKDLKNKLKIAQAKLNSRERINESYIPWANILKELASKIPKDVVLTEIDKSIGNCSINNQELNKLTISGLIDCSNPKKLEQKPLTIISFLIFNINQDKNSLLSEACIKKLEYQMESKSYKFEVETLVKKPEKEKI